MSVLFSVDCVWSKRAGYDAHGREVAGPGENVKCAVVKLPISREKSSVRADSSATRGAAHELTGDARLLFPITLDINTGDKVVIAGISLRVVGVHPRFTVVGVHHHNQVELDVWA